MSTILDRVRKLEAQRATRLAKVNAQIDATTRVARWASATARADPLAKMTRANVRACRLVELALIAQARQAQHDPAPSRTAPLLKTF
jgi:hypothetical protein